VFFPFVSERQYAEDLWAAVWGSEVGVQAVLRELDDDPIWNAQSPTHLATVLKYRIREYGFLAGIIAEGVSPAWVDAFLDQEASSILAFMTYAKRQSAAEVAELLRPNATHLMDCLRRSSAFRARIAERGKQGRTAMNKETHHDNNGNHLACGEPTGGNE
jgi:hypothetical protein